MPSFDEVLKEAGEFGRFQKKVFFLLCQTGITFAFIFVGVVFLGRNPEQYWCRLPGAAELSHRCSWSPEEEQNFTFGALKLVNSSFSDKCETSDIRWNSTSTSCTNPLQDFTNHSLGNVPSTRCNNGLGYRQPHSSIVSEFDFMCDNAWMLDLTQAFLNLGFLAGAFILGYAADRYGRILVYLSSSLGVGVCGLAVAFSSNIYLFLIFRFLQGIFAKGTWLTAYVIVTEIVGSDQRRIVGIVIQIFFTLGIIILPGIAYLIPTWQGIQLAITLPNFFFLLYYWVVPESPRWLLTRKKEQKALKIMHAIAKQNGKKLSPHYSKVLGELKNPSFLNLVKTPHMRKYTFILMYAWFTSAVVYQGLVMRIGILKGNLYLDFFISGIGELPAAILIILTIDRIGRRLPFVLSNIVAGVACLITAFLPEEIPWLKTIVATLGRLAITMSFEIVYLVNTELYPTMLR
uniref:Solute carrier family 22 member 3 n=1 Tax=Sphenodon punctatus TaxID=8508 RepID=A0A8D0L3A1_SPHPU